VRIAVVGCVEAGGALGEEVGGAVAARVRRRNTVSTWPGVDLHKASAVAAWARCSGGRSSSAVNGSVTPSLIRTINTWWASRRASAEPRRRNVATISNARTTWSFIVAVTAIHNSPLAATHNRRRNVLTCWCPARIHNAEEYLFCNNATFLKQLRLT
jgi:hypothetical protein